VKIQRGVISEPLHNPSLEHHRENLGIMQKQLWLEGNRVVGEPYKPDCRTTGSRGLETLVLYRMRVLAEE
jgi:hypothetical protein